MALANQIPMDGSNNVNPFFVRGEDTGPNRPVITRRHKWIGGGYLETMRIPLLMGRSITWDDVQVAYPAAVRTRDHGAG